MHASVQQIGTVTRGMHAPGEQHHVYLRSRALLHGLRSVPLLIVDAYTLTIININVETLRGRHAIDSSKAKRRSISN